MKIRLNQNAMRKARSTLKLARDRLALNFAAIGLDISTSTVVKWESEPDFIPRSIELFIGMCEVLELKPHELIIAEDDDGKSAVLPHFSGHNAIVSHSKSD